MQHARLSKSSCIYPSLIPVNYWSYHPSPPAISNCWFQGDNQWFSWKQWVDVFQAKNRKCFPRVESILTVFEHNRCVLMCFYTSWPGSFKCLCHFVLSACSATWSNSSIDVVKDTVSCVNYPWCCHWLRKFYTSINLSLNSQSKSPSQSIQTYSPFMISSNFNLAVIAFHIPLFTWRL